MYYIAHYGTKRHSGRYPYGSGDRPYQSSPTMAAKEQKKKAEQKAKSIKRFYKNAYKSERRIYKNTQGAEQRINARMQKIQQQPKYQQKVNEQEQQAKKRLIDSGNASAILANQDRLTNKELKTAVERIKWNNELKYLQQKQSEENFNRIDNAMQKLNKVANWAQTGANIYRTISTVRNQNLVNRSRQAEANASMAKARADQAWAWQDMLTSQAKGSAERAKANAEQNWANTEAYKAQAQMSNIAKQQNYNYKKSNFDLQNLYQSQAYKRAEDRATHQKNMYYTQANMMDRAKQANESYLNSLNKVRNNSLKSDSEYNKQLQQANLDYDDYIKKMLKRYQ